MNWCVNTAILVSKVSALLTETEKGQGFLVKETKYISIAAKIESEIILGAYHDKLPSFDELAQRYGTSKVTISKVIQLLLKRIPTI